MRFLGRLAKLWFLLSFSLSLGYFWLHNQDRMPLNLPPWIDHISIPSWLAYTAAFFAGAAVTTFALVTEIIGKSLEIRRLRKALRNGQRNANDWDDPSGSGDMPVTSRPASALSAMGSGVTPLS